MPALSYEFLFLCSKQIPFEMTMSGIWVLDELQVIKYYYIELFLQYILQENVI